MKKNEKKQWFEVKNFVLSRDNHKCVVCQILGEERNNKKRGIHVHHIIPEQFEKYRFDLRNLITLCVKHHKWSKYSAHLNAFWFVEFIKNNKPGIYEYIMTSIRENGGISNK